MPKKRNLIECKETAIGKVSIFEEFDGAVRKVVIHNPKTKWSYLSITKLRKYDGESHELESRIEIGAKYVTYFKYEKNGTHNLERRYNRDTKTTFKKQLFLETEKGVIFVTEYKGEKNINFYIYKLDENDKNREQQTGI
jgi:hypothetical protein